LSIVLFKVIPGALISFGGYQMLQRRSYAWAVAAGIIAIVACSLVSLPIGIWALAVLARDDVKAAFGANGSAPLAPRQQNHVERGLVIMLACLIPLTLGIAGLAAAMAMRNLVHAQAMPFTLKPLTAAEMQKASLVESGGEYRKESSQTFPLNANGRFGIDSVNGRIEIHGWASNTVALKTAIHGKNADGVEMVKISVDSQPDHAEVHTDLGDHFDGTWNWLRWLGRDQATVDYIVQVPQQARLAGVSCVNGHIKIDGMAGDITSSTVNGQMEIKNAAHNLKLNTVNGSIRADMDVLGRGQSVKLDAVNGEISLAVPENADATFSVTTVNGNISSEFPSLRAKKEWPVGNNLNGTLGNGDGSVKINAVNGTIRFLKNKTAPPVAANQLEAAEPNPNSLGQAGAQIASDVSGAAAAIAAAQKWLAVIDAGNYPESWREAAPVFQDRVTETAWENSLNTFRKPLGALVSRQLQSSQTMTEMPGAPAGHYVVMQFESAFAENKSAIETVTFDLEKDGQWRSSGYYIK